MGAFVPSVGLTFCACVCVHGAHLCTDFAQTFAHLHWTYSQVDDDEVNVLKILSILVRCIEAPSRGCPPMLPSRAPKSSP